MVALVLYAPQVKVKDVLVLLFSQVFSLPYAQVCSLIEVIPLFIYILELVPSLKVTFSFHYR